MTGIDDIIKNVNKTKYIAIETLLTQELEPILARHFAMGPLGMLACYSVVSKLKLAYYEALRTLTVDRDKFDVMMREVDDNMSNMNPAKEMRPFLEKFAKDHWGIPESE
ncbi:hypothetical protein [Glutamicibacter sp.]|jgi:hypothetical protein|uniref:hypothetical protein n=1 Tax=Glutamicibacter sp. TaxID=1931995 RepID=UPI002B491E39|nr:hypothetical protein [Glutamicibacter sp.]HJX79165.1 hypothetical protein [Glutamicibacter sp.]